MARNLYESIVEFVNVWSDVVEKKLLEYAATDPEKKQALVNKSLELVKANPDSPFAFIYNWLEIGEDNEGNAFVKPHKAKKRPGDAEEPSKMRDNEHPCGADICDYFCIHPTGSYNDDASVEQSVYRALPILEQKNRIKKYNLLYYPSTIEYRRKAMATDLADLAPLKKDCFFAVSKNTYIVYFENVKPDFKNEKKFFTDYLEKDLQEIIVYENRLVIFVKGNREKCNSIGVLLRKTVKDAYILQQNAANGK